MKYHYHRRRLQNYILLNEIISLLPLFSSTISSLLTLFSKFFSSFLRSTCLLSVSYQYLALEEVYLPIRAAVPNNPTLRIPAYGKSFANYGVITLYDHPFQGVMRRFILLPKSLDYNSMIGNHRFTIWAFACSLAVTEAILVSFFSSAYWYA